MPSISTIIGDFIGGATSLIPAVTDLIGAFNPQPPIVMSGQGGGFAPMPARPIALPGGAPIGGAMPVGLGLDLPFVDVVPQGAACITPRNSVSRRLPARVDVPMVDASGNSKIVTYKNMGRPVLYTGDFAAAKRVKKVAGRARRAAGGR